MSVVIKSVVKKSSAYYAGIKAGMVLCTINGNSIQDRLDYDFYSTDEDLSIVCESNGEKVVFDITKDEYEDLGLGFETYLMDSQQSCKNKCVFCFIDQNPKGMREPIYFKDDDSRMSFLKGNYITLTSVSDEELERIIKYRINVNVSVHTTEPALRVEMMKNPRAAEIMNQLKKLADGGISINCQVVLCPGINDGDHLKKTVDDLAGLYPAVTSVAVVPVGLTDHRECLADLRLHTREESAEVIDYIELFGKEFKKKHGTSFVFAADEFYINANRAIPESGYYEDYPQYENGVGMLASLLSDAEEELACRTPGRKKAEVHIITGVAAAPYIMRAVEMIKEKCHGLTCEVHTIENHFFGKGVTVAGLVAGCDICGQLSGKKLRGKVYIPDSMLRYERDMFIDSMTLKEVSKKISAKIIPLSVGGGPLVSAITEVCGCERI